MKLLICTQVMDKNDPILGFFHRWVEEFAAHTEQVMVICLKEGEHSLPSNARVLSLGKETGVSRIKYIARFFSYIWSERKNYDAVFVHMNQVYVLLGGLLWRMWGKKIGLWYVHKNVTMSLRLATVMVDYVFTTSPESFRIPSPKRLALGHGIDTNLFTPGVHHESDILRLLTVGRIAPAKNIAAMITLTRQLYDRTVPVALSIIGVPVLDVDREYKRELHKLVEDQKLGEVVHFDGVVTQEELPTLYRSADVFLNFSATGSMDKAVLEALACGVPVVTSNAAFKGLLEPYGLFVEIVEAQPLADAVVRARGMDMAPLVERIRTEHSLSHLVPVIVTTLSA